MSGQVPEPPHKEAARSFMSGFAGCFGVGAAIIAAVMLLGLLGEIASHH